MANASLLAAVVLLAGSTPHVAGSAPKINLFESTSNVFGRAQVNRSVGVVRYLGRVPTEADCTAACVAYSGLDGAVCNSFSYHHQDFPSSDFAGACYAVADHSWEPVTPSAKISSGRLAWPNEPCGSPSPIGCQWMADPVCLAPGNQMGGAVLLAPSAAAARCAQTPSCVGWTHDGARNASDVPVMVTFKNSTAEVRGGGTGCWSFRKYYSSRGAAGAEGHEQDPFRTGFHFQPTAYWMNDPNGPMYDNRTGLYHLFYQWNPRSNTGFVDMHWGHAVSTDMVRWRELPIALYPDAASCGGEWSGSATTDTPLGPYPILSYSVQCNSYFGVAWPANPADPLLVNWTANHVVGHKAPDTGGFRDPSSAWLGPDSKWRQLLACAGASCLYESPDFKTWEYSGHMFGDGKGPTWEMPDIFPLPPPAAAVGPAGPHSGADGPTASAPLLFMKVGMENGTDYWTTGQFDYGADNFTVGTSPFVNPTGYAPAQQCDYGAFYSSKTFAGPVPGGVKALIGWVAEGAGSPLKDWAGLQSVPRAVTSDPQRPGSALFYPIQQVDTLRGPKVASTYSVSANQPVLVRGISGWQLDLVVTFSGPFVPGVEFGVGVLASDEGAMMTRVSLLVDRGGRTGTVSVLGHRGPFPLSQGGTQVTLRVLVDRSLVEVFVDDGTAAVTGRIYPGSTDATGVYLFCNGGQVEHVGGVCGMRASFEGYEMRNATAPSLQELREHALAHRTLA